ncbi:hypothetical protein QBC46DRAFT_323408 [Diplogelasinospora grovesii]|uniref:Clr5 domain-containing protein n=1 Tax=Diplogelasinospora grovesii TaxID=303347 RepID=A0AAN6MYH6_9PEZI|nr:hypothetical protein QBC46DRAFT_323408 [Diplogelasinospora grovesii]
MEGSSESGSTGSSSAAAAAPVPQKSKWATEEDFDRHRATITRLYAEGTLRQLMETMECEYGFVATPKMYKTRFKRWGLWKHNRAGNVIEIVRLKKQRDAAQKPSQFLLHGRRKPIPTYLRGPDELQNEEGMYRAIRDYYDGALSAQRWVFNEDISSPSSTGLLVQAKRTSVALRRGTDVWLRFRTALATLEEAAIAESSLTIPCRTTPDKKAQGIKLMRICFAELSQIILSGYESPMLLFWLLHVMTLFRESTELQQSSDPQLGRSVELQLLKHLYELTATTPQGHHHPTARLWRMLWSGGKGIGRDRYHLRLCTNAAVEQFERHIGYLHPRTVELLTFSIFSSTPTGAANAQEKEDRFRTLYNQLQTSEVFDGRHLEVLCCLASHLRRHGKLEEGEALLEEILTDPERAQVLGRFPEDNFNVHSLLGNIKNRLGRPAEAEPLYRKAIGIAKIARRTSNEDSDLFEGLFGLEKSLRDQGRLEEADEVVEEHRALVRESLEKVGEKEDTT